MYRCLIITNATRERIFLTLKLLENWHRSIMTQERLSSLAIMTTDNEILQTTDFDFKDTLKDFTEQIN